MDGIISNIHTKKRKLEQDSEDDEAVCGICLGNFTNDGDHRVTSLKCGHIFGYLCIRTWVSTHHQKCCPQCKATTRVQDFRTIYVSKLKVVDNSIELDLKKKLALKNDENYKLNLRIRIQKLKLAEQKKLHAKQLKHYKSALIQASSNPPIPEYRLFKVMDVDMAKDSQCRLMTYGPEQRLLFVSQKSSDTLCPGYGLRSIDTTIFKATNFIHVGPKPPKDLTFNVPEQLIATVCGDNVCHIFDPTSLSKFQTFRLSESTAAWSCAFDRKQDNLLYVGANAGRGYVYDIRSPAASLSSFQTEADKTPIIKISHVKSSKLFSMGGFLVCHMRTIWFYEYVDRAHNTRPIKLDMDGPFISMNYDYTTDLILFNIRGSPSKYILTKLDKCNDVVFLVKISTFNGSYDTSLLTKTAQFNIADIPYVSYYNLDDKKLKLWKRTSGVFQNISIADTVTDLCTMYFEQDCITPYLAALSENKCQVYKIL